MIQTKQKPFLGVSSEAAYCAGVCEKYQDKNKQEGFFCFFVQKEEIDLETARASMRRGVVLGSVILLS